MSMGDMNRLLDQLRRAALRSTGQCCTDGELVQSFLARRDEAAFEALVRRHGSMVLAVCRRVLGNVHDAEDAFQATFLVLVRKAGSVRPREAVGNWLYGVAYRTALEARTRLARRRAKERQVVVMPQPEVEAEEHLRDLRLLLDQELSRLPDKYRLPVVLCDLEGRSRQEVARQLAIPAGTLSSRLATARQRLAKRLARHGLAVSGGSLAALLAGNGASGGVPGVLVVSTTKAAMLVAAGQAAAAGVVSVKVAALTEGVLKTMFLAKLKTATVVVCGVAAIGLGTGELVYRARAGASGLSGAGRTHVEVQAEPAQAPGVVQESPRGSGGAEQKEPRAAQARHGRRVEEVAEDRESLLRYRMDRERREAEAQRAQAEYNVAEARLRQAEERLREATEQLKRAQYAAKVARQEAEPVQPPARSQPERMPEPTALELKHMQLKFEEAKAKMLREFEQRRKELMEKHKAVIDELKALDAMQRDALIGLEKQQAEVLRQVQEKESSLHRKSAGRQRQQRPEGPKPQAGGDKLDRILERLEHIERRLEHLERRGSPPGR